MGVQRTIPLFNLGRQDLPHVVLLCVFLASVALILRAGQGKHPAGTTAWRDLLVIFGTLGALVLCCLAVVKIFYSYFSDSGVLSQGYAQLEEGEPVAKAHTHEVKPQQAAAPVPQPREVVPPRPVSDSVTTARSYRSFTPREEEDIECGLLLEASAVDFEYNGVRHQKGSLRVIKVERDGVCERQGACVVGDVLVAVDGKEVAGMHPNKVKALMRGKAGTSIILGLYTDQSREIINRSLGVEKYECDKQGFWNGVLDKWGFWNGVWWATIPVGGWNI